MSNWYNKLCVCVGVVGIFHVGYEIGITIGIFITVVRHNFRVGVGEKVDKTTNVSLYSYIYVQVTTVKYDMNNWMIILL